MIDAEEALELIKWIQNWKKIYGENPTLQESKTWFEWKFIKKSLSKSEEESIAIVLKNNSN